MIKNDYYSEKIKEIKELIKDNPKLAFQKLQEELNMPYIPEKYEKKFYSLLKNVKSDSLINIKINNELSKEEVIEILKNGDSVKINLALSKLRDLNINSILKDIHKIIKSKKISVIIKSIIYEYCVEQNIDHIFEWNNMKINPLKIGSIINLDIYKSTIKFIDKTIIQNPSLKDVAFQNLELYILNSFPEIINSSYNLGPAIVQIAHELMGLSYINIVDKKEINKIKEKLQNQL
ncbi:MAG: hypothetical protein GY679_00645 [Mycoplasma sp.]|nr:hypothetical protein [Mycoplasma sp.]